MYNPPTSNLDLLGTRGEKYETCPHPTGQRRGDKVRQNYENHQQIDKTLPVTMSTNAMDTEEGDAITKMILDKFGLVWYWFGIQKPGLFKINTNKLPDTLMEFYPLIGTMYPNIPSFSANCNYCLFHLGYPPRAVMIMA